MDAVLLETSLALVDTPDDGLTTRFYALLFQRPPSVRPLFSDDLGRQARMLRSAILSVVDHLDDPLWRTETTDAWIEALDALSGLTLLGHPADEELAS